MTNATTVPVRMRVHPRLVLVTLLAALAAGLTGCASGASSGTPPVTSPAAALIVTDPWVKAADNGMTAAFGTLVNNTDAEITVVGATTSVSKTELHEVVMDGGAMKMQPKAGGFVIPARGRHELEPGGDHIMLVGLTAPVKAGESVEFTLTLKDGATVQFSAVAKPFAGGNESYDPGLQTGGMPSATPSHG